MRFRSVANTTIGVIGACLLLAAPSFSQEDQENSGYSRNGPYVGVNVIGASYLGTNDLHADEVAGFNLYSGYRMTPFLALEIQYEWLAKADVKSDEFGKVGDIEISALTGNLKMFFWPERFQPYAVVGMGSIQVHSNQSGAGPDETESEFAFRFGAGLDFYITEHIVASAGANYLLPAGAGLEDLDYVSFGGGIQYRF